MSNEKKFWFVLIGAILAMVIIACSCGSITPTPTAAPRIIATSPAPVNPLPGLAGYWQDGNKVFTIAWQNSQYIVSAVHSAPDGTLTLSDQSWDGSSLTWTYHNASTNASVTYTTTSVSGDNLYTNFSNTSGGSGTATLLRTSSPMPSYTSLPYHEDFSDPRSGWDIYDDQDGSVGYQDGYYFASSNTNGTVIAGYAYRFFGDTVIEVDATPVSGPTNSNFGYGISCRIQDNGDRYDFEITADGYYVVFLVSQDNAQKLVDKSSGAIKKGMATNHMAVTCAGNELKLEVNGQVLFDGQDSTYSQGDIALYAITYEDNAPAEAHFTNLVVRAP